MIMLECRLQLIAKYPFDICKEDNPMALNYTCFADRLSGRKMEIEGHGFRYLSQDENRRLVLIIIDQSLSESEQIVIKVPFTVSKWFKSNGAITVHRQKLALSTPILPKLQFSKQVNIYFNSTFSVDQAIIKFLSNCDFVCLGGQYFIDCLWLKPYLHTFTSIKSQLFWQAQINKRSENKTTYLRIYIQHVEKSQAQRLFRKGETKLTIKSEALHPYNIYRRVQLDHLHRTIFHHTQYGQFVGQALNTPLKNQLSILETQKDIGLQKLLHYFSQQKLKVDFKLIDCNIISSTKQFWSEFSSITHNEDSVVLITNIKWIEELYQAEQISNFQLKDILKKMQKEFEDVSALSLRKYCVFVEHFGEAVAAESLPNIRNFTLKLDKPSKMNIFKIIFEQFQKENANMSQITHQFHDKFGWQIFLNFLSSSWLRVRTLEKGQIIKKLRELVKQQQVQNIIEVSWDDVGGLQTAKEEIIQTVLLPIKHPQIFDQWIKPRTGLLFYGPPGTGKTLLGKCVAKECKMSFISVKGPELLNMYVGESEKNVREVFQRARSCSPCIIFMDQLDALVPKRGNSGDSNQVMDRIVAQLLQQMDSASANQVFIIGATNRPDLLDPSILRPGRFDKQIYLGITQAKEDRIKIIKAQTRHLNLQQNLNWDPILQRIPKNFTGADFYGLTSKAVMAAAERTIQEYQSGVPQQKIVLTALDFLSAIEGIKPSVTQADLARYQTLKKIYS